VNSLAANDTPVRTRREREPEPQIDSPAYQRQIVQRLFEAFGRRDLSSVLDLVHPEIVFEPMTAAVTQAGEPYRGHEGMRDYVADVQEHWQELTVHPVQIRAAGQAVVVLGLASGRGPAGSFEDAPATWVLKFSEGLVIHIQIFSDARHVLDALGERRI
jgi:ketosteroid isomerase-like protein